MDPRIVRQWATEEHANAALKSINLIQQTKIWVQLYHQKK